MDVSSHEIPPHANQPKVLRIRHQKKFIQGLKYSGHSLRVQGSFKLYN